MYVLEPSSQLNNGDRSFLLARAITERVLSIPAIRECNSVSCYLSMEAGEVNTSIIVDALLQSGEYADSLLEMLLSPYDEA
jgi:hypothetical protein